jgi:NAD(P)-dependent dehydrogenase (short-subunit alcohol dehydrogenase family)
VALVTGGSRGIGAAIARRLAADGADVALTYARSAVGAHEVVAAVEATGRRARAFAADNRDAAAVERAVEATVAELGQLDILVNNAGVFIAGPVSELGIADFDETVAVNLRAAFVASRAASARLGEDGRIVSIGSNLALRSGEAGLSHLFDEQGRAVGHDKGAGARSRPARHHREHRAPGLDRYRHEPRKRPGRGSADFGHGHGTVQHAR